MPVVLKVDSDIKSNLYLLTVKRLQFELEIYIYIGSQPEYKYL